MDAERSYLFKHAILRDAAYELQLVSDRASLHAAAIEIIERLFGGREHIPPSLALEMVRHVQGALQTQSDADLQQLQDSELHYMLAAAQHARSNRSLNLAADLFWQAANHSRQNGPGAVVAATKAASANASAGNYQTAAEQVSVAVEMAERAGDAESLAVAYEELGKVYQHRSLRQEALEAYEKAREYLTQVDLPTTKSRVLGGLGLIHRDLGDREKGREMLEKSQKIAIAMDLWGYQVGNLINLAVILFDERRHNDGRELLQRAQAIAEQMGSRRRLAGVLGVVAAGYRDEGRFDEAVARFPEVVRAMSTTGDRGYEAWYRCEYAICLAHCDRLEEARQQMEAGMAMLREIGDAYSIGFYQRIMKKEFNDPESIFGKYD